MKLPFTKMQGAGNDFVVLDVVRHPEIAGWLAPAHVQRLADRHFGVGADQVLVVDPSPAPGIDFGYRIFNADGGEVSHCGNGARCFLHYVRRSGLAPGAAPVTVRTRSRTLRLVESDDGRVAVEMGTPVFAPAQVPFDAAGLQPRAVATPAGDVADALWTLDGTPPAGLGAPAVAIASMGNPHAVLRVDDVDTALVAALGPWIETHPRFPERVNAGFLQVLSPTSARLRVHERGAGETLACGTGACAAVACGIRLGWLQCPRVDVQARGGRLTIEWDGRDGSPLRMLGPAEIVYEGTIEL